MGAMPHHRFRVGQTVVAPSGVRDALIPPGPYVIVRLLPADGGEPHYRVKSAADGHERALLEAWSQFTQCMEWASDISMYFQDWAQGFCYWEWIARSQQYIYQFISCMAYPF